MKVLKGLIITVGVVAAILVGAFTWYTATTQVSQKSITMRCRINRVVLVDEYQQGRSLYPTQLKWILYTDEGYELICYDSNYRVGDSVDVELRTIQAMNRNK
jgi:hypothetical protein